MQPSVPSPVQPKPGQPFQPWSGSLPTWAELPATRQQEVIKLLASLLLRQWTSQRPASPEVTYDQPG